MLSVIDLYLTMALLVAYCYTQVKALSSLAKVDPALRVPRRPNGTIKLRAVRTWALISFLDRDENVQESIRMINLSNSLIYIYIILLVCHYAFRLSII